MFLNYIFPWKHFPKQLKYIFQHKLIASVDEFRNEQKSLLAEHPEWTVGDVTTSNITIINGGVQVNVVPEKFEACE